MGSGFPLVRVYSVANGECGCAKGKACPSAGRHPIGGPKATIAEAKGLQGLNLGLATGTVFALDVDVKGDKQGTASLQALVASNGPLPKGPASQTGSGGFHFFFRAPDGVQIKNSVENLGPGLDVRGHGGFVVLPPSRHVSGNQYRWAVPLAPLPGGMEPPPAPGWLLDLIRADTPKAGAAGLDNPEFWGSSAVRSALSDIDKIDKARKLQHARDYLQNLGQANEGEGGDNRTLIAAGAGHRFGLSAEDFWPVLVEWNERNRPPWDADDLAAKLRNSATYTERESGWGLLPRDVTDPKPGPQLADDPDDYTLASNGQMELARHVLEHWGAFEKPARVQSDSVQLYLYDSTTGLFTGLSRAVVQSRVMELQDRSYVTAKGSVGRLDVTVRLRNDVTEQIMKMPGVLNEKFLLDPPIGLATRSGWLCLENGVPTLKPHSPLHKAFHGLDFDYDPETDTTEWETFLHGVFVDDAYDKVKLLQEFTGMALFGSAAQGQKAIMLTGEGNNGKSTVMDLIATIFPEGTTASSSPQDWAGYAGQYNVAKLRGVLLNSVSEIPERQILASDKFKQIITGEPISSREPTEKVQTFTPIAGHIFSANDLPATGDNSEGFWRRFLVVVFDRNFGEQGEEGAKTKGDVMARFTNKKDQILAWAVRGIERRLARGAYTKPKSHNDAIKGWRTNTDAVADFIEACCEIDSGAKTPLSEIYGHFRKWAQYSGRGNMGSKTLAKRLGQVPSVKGSRGSRGAVFTIVVKPSGDWKDYEEGGITW